jgi:uncharacterized protein YdhG (YjbR/CyaY superfamily)
MERCDHEAMAQIRKGGCLSYDETLAARLRTLLAAHENVVEKKMFGGLCFMVGEAMCCGVLGVDLIVRVGTKQYAEALARPHARSFDFTGKPSKGLVYVSPDGIRDRASLARWVRRGLAFPDKEPLKLKKTQVRSTKVDEYLATVTVDKRAALDKLRRTIRSIVPRAEECISYGMPAFRLDGNVIAGFQATAKGCSYYPFSGTTLQTLGAHLRGYGKTKSALHFSPDKPLPLGLVRELIKARIAETR